MCAGCARGERERERQQWGKKAKRKLEEKQKIAEEASRNGAKGDEENNKQIPNLDFKNTSYHHLSTVQQRSTFYLFGMLVFGVLKQRKR